MRTGANAAVRERMRGLGRLGAELLVPALDRYASVALEDPSGPAGSAAPGGPPREQPGPPVHDVCAVAWVAQPGLFGLVPAWVQVETAGRLTAGMTVTDFAAAGLAAQVADGGNARVAMSIDVDGFWDLTLGVYQRVAQAMG
jgi:purine nucleosidase